METGDGTILIVDDSATQRLAVRDILERGGYRVAEARDGTDALEFLAREVPLLVISDIMMPQMDGYGLCRRIRAADRLSLVPVILLTSLSHPEDIIRALECGVNNFIVKPCAESTLLARVQDMILNMELRRSGGAQLSIQIYSYGKKHRITADRLQIVDLLLSSYENAVESGRAVERLNRELLAARREAEDAIRWAGERLERLRAGVRAGARRLEGLAAGMPDGKAAAALRQEAADLLALPEDGLQVGRPDGGSA